MLDENAQNKIREIFSNASGQIFTYLTKFISNMLNSSLGFLNFISNIFLTPIISFYFIRDYESIKLSINNIININLAPVNKLKLENTIGKINLIIKNYLKSQASVCSFMAIYYFICLKILGLEYSLTLAIISGLFTVIPYLGFVISLTLSLTIGFIESFAITDLGVIAIIYVIGQTIESNFITPRLVGSKLDIHPVLIIFAITLFGNLFGLMGAVIAVPLIAIIKFLLVDFYKYSTQKGY